MPDPCSTLPSPLPVLILNEFDNLETLDCLLHASPAANAIFRQHYCEIIESILSNLTLGLRKLLRIVASIRSGPSDVRRRCNSLEDYNTFRATQILHSNAGAERLHKTVITLSAARRYVVP